MALIRRTFSYTGASQLFTLPAGVKRVRAFGFGGGGGGSGGRTGSSVTNTRTPGGAGGGCAALCDVLLDVSPGEQLTIDVGAGGAGGAADNHGSDGNATTITGAVSGSLASFPGGGKAYAAASINTYSFAGSSARVSGETAGQYWFNHGGGDTQGGPSGGSSGSGQLINKTRIAYGSLTDHSSRSTAAGNPGADSGSYFGGMGGGGGAPGHPLPGVLGLTISGVGGKGGDANSAGAGVAAVAGTAGAQGGGGGGGGGGCCASVNTNGAGGAGGDGGDGWLCLEWWE